MSMKDQIDYTSAIGGGYPQKQSGIATPGELEALIKRIHAMASDADGIRDIAGRTADRLFGGENVVPSKEVRPSRVGQMGEMEDALDDLLDGLIGLRVQVERLARL